MKKNHFQISAIVLILGIFFGNCHSKSDNSLYQTNALLVNYLNDQLSGNCAVVQKNTVSSVSTYTATGYTVPKGGCNSATLGSSYTTTASDIVTKTDAYFDKITAILDTYSACSNMSSIIKGSTSSAALNSALATSSFTGSVKTATTATNITSLATANTTDSANGPANCRTIKIGLLYTAGIFCSSATDSTNAQNNIKYYVVNSVSTDMLTNYEGNREILSGAKTTNDSVNFYTKAAISSMRMMTSSELTALNSTTNQPKLDSYALTLGVYSGLATAAATTLTSLAATISPLITGAPTCLAAITAGDATTKDYLIRIPTANYTTSSTLNSNISFADKNAVTTPFIPSLTCKYGDGFTAITNTSLSTSTAAVGFCPATYTKF